MIDKLHLQSTAYLLSTELPPELVNRLNNHPYNDLTDVVTKIVNEELDSWQYCYIQNNPDNKSIPEYILNTVSLETVEAIAEELIDEDTPIHEEDTPQSRDRQLVEAAGGREEYCEQQIEWYTEACVRTLTPTLIELLEEHSEETFDREQIDPISEDIVQEFGLWRWYLLTKQSRESDKDTSTVVNERVLTELDDYFIQLLKERNIYHKIDSMPFTDELSSFQ